MKKEYKKILVILFLSIAAIAVILSGIHIYIFKTLTNLYRMLIDLVSYSVLGIVVIEFIVRIFKLYGKKAHIEKYIGSIITIFRLFSYFILILILLNLLKININGLLIGAGFLSVIFGLAAQTSLGNIFAGLSLLSLKPFHIGDKITISTWVYPQLPPTYPHDLMTVSITGKVTEIGLIYTTILNEDNIIFYIPNNALNQALIINHNKMDKKQIKITLEVAINKNYNIFRKKLEHEIKKNAYLLKTIFKYEISISFISNSTYGIEIKAIVEKSNEKIIRDKIMDLTMNLLNSL